MCAPGSDQPLNAETVRAQLAALLALPGAQPASLTELARVKRSALPGLFRKLSPAVVEELARLRFAPILINADSRPARLPLTELRQAERGIEQPRSHPVPHRFHRRLRPLATSSSMAFSARRWPKS